MSGVEDALSYFIGAELHYRDIGFNETVDDILNNKHNMNHQSMEGCFVSSITCSFNYVNAAHFDVDDACLGIITWTFDDHYEEGECYFVLPNVTVDGEKTLIIKIKHSTTINIDARIIMHGSTLSFKGKNNNVYGTFFGLKQF